MTTAAPDAHEQWLPVVGYEGLYEVSDMGRVRSVDRLVSRGREQYKPHQVPKPGRIKSSQVQGLGYVGVGLWKDGQLTSLRVHRLVLEAFVGPAPEGMETLHGNGVRHDNRLVNLRWGTREENLADRVRHGTARPRAAQPAPAPARRCGYCPTPLPVTARADARFCSGRCRVAAHRAKGR